MLTIEDLKTINKRNDLIDLADQNGINTIKLLSNLRYEDELKYLQVELVNFQQWILKKKMRVAVLLEGRDAAGKGGTIKRFIEHMNPRSMRVVALSKPTKVERGSMVF